MSKFTEMIDFNQCRFNFTSGRDCTARISLCKEFRIPNVYTLEASFYGYKDSKSGIFKHFDIQDLKNLGKNICLTLF